MNAQREEGDIALCCSRADVVQFTGKQSGPILFALVGSWP